MSSFMIPLHNRSMNAKFQKYIKIWLSETFYIEPFNKKNFIRGNGKGVVYHRDL